MNLSRQSIALVRTHSQAQVKLAQGLGTDNCRPLHLSPVAQVKYGSQIITRTWHISAKCRQLSAYKL